MKTGAYLILAILLLALVSNVAASSSIAQKFGSTDVQPNGIIGCITKLIGVGRTTFTFFVALVRNDMDTVVDCILKITRDIPLIQAACSN